MPVERTGLRTGSLGRRLRDLLDSLLFAVVGAWLTILPWLPNWDQNYFSGTTRLWYSIWMHPYFRGAISGVGVVNLGICLLGLMERRRRARE